MFGVGPQAGSHVRATSEGAIEISESFASLITRQMTLFVSLSQPLEESKLVGVFAAWSAPSLAALLMVIWL
jgi:hypothetical protein